MNRTNRYRKDRKRIAGFFIGNWQLIVFFFYLFWGYFGAVILLKVILSRLKHFSTVFCQNIRHSVPGRPFLKLLLIHYCRLLFCCLVFIF